MQISSGWGKGLKLRAPGGSETRPTAAKVRAAILNMLAPYLDQALFLDLYAGSGAMGLEALSRGARGAVFVEQARPALQALRQNLAELERRAQVQGLGRVEAQVLPVSVQAALPRLARERGFDVIFADPPYKDWAEVAQELLEPLATLAAAGAALVIETAAADAAGLVTAVPPAWEVVKQRSYGDTMITVLEKSAAAGGERQPGGEHGSQDH